MAELTYEQKLILQNSTAHLQKVLEDIADANKLLASSLITKEELLQELSVLNGQLFDARVELNATVVKTKSSAEAMLSRQQEVEKKEAELQVKIALDDALFSKIQRELEDAARANETYISDLKHDITDLEAKKVTLEVEIKDQEDWYAEVSFDVQNAIKTLNKLTQDIDDLRASSLEEKQQIDAEIEKANAELARVHALVLEELEKIDMPMKALEERELEVAKRESNFEVIKARLNRVHQKYYPGQLLNI